MHRALIIGPTPDWARAAGLIDLLQGLGFEGVGASRAGPEPGEDNWRILMVRVSGDDPLSQMPAQLPAVSRGNGTIRLAVKTANCANVGEVMDDTIIEPVRERDLIELLSRHACHPLTAAETAGCVAQISMLAGDDADTAAELLCSLVETLRTDLAELRTACVARQPDRVRSSAHRLKVSARMLDCRSLVAMSEHVETTAGTTTAEELESLACFYMQAFERLGAHLESLR